MKEKFLLEKLQTNSGHTSIWIILVTTALIVLLILPLWAYTFDHALLRIAYEEIIDQLDLLAYRIVKDLAYDQYSQGQIHLSLETETLEILHPQIEWVHMESVTFNTETQIVAYVIDLQYVSTLYDFKEEKRMHYQVHLPLDR